MCRNQKFKDNFKLPKGAIYRTEIKYAQMTKGRKKSMDIYTTKTMINLDALKKGKAIKMQNISNLLK